MAQVHPRTLMSGLECVPYTTEPVTLAIAPVDSQASQRSAIASYASNFRSLRFWYMMYSASLKVTEGCLDAVKTSAP